MLEFVEFLSSSDDEEEHEMDECDWTRTNQSKGTIFLWVIISLAMKSHGFIGSN